MDNHLNKLEQAILNWIKQKYRNIELSNQIDTALFLSRKWTVVGFYIEFSVPKTAKEIDLLQFGNNRVIDGPWIKSKDVEFDGGSELYIDNGYVNCLELFANGSYFRENVIDFELFDDNEINKNLKQEST